MVFLRTSHARPIQSITHNITYHWTQLTLQPHTPRSLSISRSVVRFRAIGISWTKKTGWTRCSRSPSTHITILNMSTTATTELLAPNFPAPPKIAPKDDSSGSDNWSHGLKSKWPVALDLAGSNLPCRLEGEVENLVCPLLTSRQSFIKR